MRIFNMPLLLLIIFISTTLNAQTFNEAISKKDTSLIYRLIREGEDINKPDQYGSTPLMSACRYSIDTAIVKFLLQHGAEPDSPRTEKGRTALLVACAYYGDVPAIRMLIKYGADVNAAAYDGSTALMLAAKSFKSNLVSYLLMMGANAAANDAKGNTALSIAENTTLEAWMKTALPDAGIDKDKTIQLLKEAMKL